jgi:hypothetical protein
MRMTAKAIGVAALAAVLGATSVAPAAAASFSFGFSTPGFFVHSHDDYWRHRHPVYPRYPRYPRPAISIDIGPLHLSAGHISRCEARFRSYDRSTDMYMGFDGRHHYCRL